MFTTILQSKKFHRVARICGMMLLMAMMMTLVAFAGNMNNASGAANSIQQGVSNGADSLYSVMKAIILPIAALALAWCGFKAIFGGQKGMEEAKKYALIIVVVIAVVFLAPVVVQEVGGWFASSSSSLKNLTPTTTP